MHKLRVAAAATVVALLGAFASVGPANAASGIGTTETNTSLVDVSLGSNGNALRVRVLGDDAKATVDPAVGPVSAFSQMFAVKVTSSLVPALNNLTIPNPPLESRTPGGSGNVTGPVLNLANAVPVLGSAVASGALAPVNLSSAIDGGVARSGLTANLANLGLVGGLISANAVESKLGALAGAATAEGERSINVDAVSVLNLGALLKGLGIDLANLPVPAVSSILDGLDVPVAGVPSADTLGTFVSTLNTTITDLTAASGTFSALPAPLQGVLGGLNLPVETGGIIPDPTTVTALLGQVTDLLDDVLGTAMSTLDGVTLLKFNGLKVGTVTKAVKDVSGSKSEVIGTLGGVSVGNLPVLSGIDLGSTLAQVTGLVDTIQGTLDGVLNPLGLAGLVSLKFFDKASTNGVSASGGYTRSLAGITGVSLAITPPANLLGIVNGLLPANGIGSAITGNGGTIPVVGTLMSTLGGTGGVPGVGGVVGALTGGASLKVASVTTGSNFAAPGAVPISTPTLPRTGANTTAFLVMGMLMVAAALVGRRYIPSRVNSDS